MNFTPYVTGSASASKPYEDYYDTPVYDMRDLDEDGAPDNPELYIMDATHKNGTER